MTKLSTFAAVVIAASAVTVLAQGYPGGGAGGMGRARSHRAEPDDASGKMREPNLPLHPLAALAAALERETPSMKLSPAAAAAMSDFVREARDFAALEDRRMRERIGIARSVVHANVDLQRDLTDIEESTREVDASARDVIARWKKLEALLDAAQRDRVQGIYSAALIDARPSPRDVNPRRNPG